MTGGGCRAGRTPEKWTDHVDRTMIEGMDHDDPGPEPLRNDDNIKRIPAAEFKQRCLRILDELGPEGVVVTKRGKPIARAVPVREKTVFEELYGSIPNIRVDPDDDLFSTGAWVSDEWGDQNFDQPRHARPDRPA
jgi:antitoxin (DNA-binding transcriptional repressor) of toxin-antitoxin stability system